MAYRIPWTSWFRFCPDIQFEEEKEGEEDEGEEEEEEKGEEEEVEEEERREEEGEEKGGEEGREGEENGHKLSHFYRKDSHSDVGVIAPSGYNPDV